MYYGPQIKNYVLETFSSVIIEIEGEQVPDLADYNKLLQVKIKVIARGYYYNNDYKTRSNVTYSILKKCKYIEL